MQVHANSQEEALIFNIEGRIDATTAGSLESSMLSSVQSTDKAAVLLDFKDVEYISSAGLRTMLKLAKLCQQKKLKLRLFGMQPNVFEVFKVSGFNGIIKINPTLDEALSSLKE